MEPVLGVTLPVATDAPKLVGSPEGSGRGSSRSGVVFLKDRCHQGVARGRKDYPHGKNSSLSASWPKTPDSLRPEETDSRCGLANEVLSKHFDFSTKSSRFYKDIVGKPLLEKSSKKMRNSGVGSKRSVMVEVECVSGSGTSQDFASSSACCNISVKNRPLKGKSNLACGRGVKRNNKVKYKNVCESSFSKNGLLSISSTTKVNDFSGIYGLKPNVFDIAKYSEDLSLDELLQGSYRYLSIAEGKGKGVADSNDIFLQSVQKACSILQARKVSPDENISENDCSGIQGVSTGSLSHSSLVGQTQIAAVDKSSVDLSSCQKVKDDSDGMMNFSAITDAPLYCPEDVLDRLALPRTLISDLVVLPDVNKTASSKNSCCDIHTGKLLSCHCNGLPPFPWSHSFSGNTKTSFDATKLSASRATCQGRWIKLQNHPSAAPPPAGFHLDFNSLAFNQILVPPVTQAAASAIQRDSSLQRHRDEKSSPAYTAAQTLVNMASPRGTSKLNRKQHSGLKGRILLTEARRKPRPGYDGAPPKKLRLSLSNSDGIYSTASKYPPPDWPHSSKSFRK